MTQVARNHLTSKPKPGKVKTRPTQAESLCPWAVMTFENLRLTAALADCEALKFNETLAAFGVGLTAEPACFEGVGPRFELDMAGQLPSRLRQVDPICLDQNRLW